MINQDKVTYGVINDADYLADDEHRMLCQAEAVKQVLAYCSAQPGASITISVKTNDGSQQACAELYDAAALVGSLYDALEYFQSEALR